MGYSDDYASKKSMSSDGQEDGDGDVYPGRPEVGHRRAVGFCVHRGKCCGRCHKHDTAEMVS